MPEERDFGALYKALLDRNIEPDAVRSEALLHAILRQLFPQDARKDAQTATGENPPGE